MHFIELLSPAKNLECGLAAINHGADAVYIGASQFGARAAAGNSVEDIEQLCSYAHRYRSKVFVALNTVLTDNQLPEAEKIIHQVYNAGADALIVQDMGILKLDLPPIALHASTQTDNRTIEKVRFLQEAGFSRVVLARELSLKQISEISAGTNVELEAFVYGALCVSYSGQCYMSQAMCGRSANRGQCAQYCRLPYHLLDADGNILQKNKHLLSLKDLDLSAHLEEMAEAGVMSFKIEGRLKDIDYVKNITSFYRQKIDQLLESTTTFKKTSSGKTRFFFEPNPEKSFRRGATDFFLHGRQKEIIQPDTPKSLGEPMGKVTYISNHFFEMQNGTQIHNGDGMCFINPKGDLTGFRVNRVDGKKIFPADMPKINTGLLLYRNQNQEFERIIQGKTSERKIQIKLSLEDSNDGFILKVSDEDGTITQIDIPFDKQPAQKPDAVIENIKIQLSKLGNTIYEASSIDVQLEKPWFIPSSQLAEWRRTLIEKLESERAKMYHRELPRTRTKTNFGLTQLTYLGNVTNEHASVFYKEHGVKDVQSGFEVKAQEGVPLMFCKHCIKFSMGWCPKQGYKSTYKEPLFLKNNDQLYRLEFDCKLCEMKIYKHQ